ncbi:MAG TPA: S8 family peptidase [Vicinamibacterales bacterium]|nr:S8 family peptidase [Vicinamibacterales bacterium]
MSVKEGCRDFVRTSLQKHGDPIRSEHPFINAIVVDLHSEDVPELASHSCVKNLAFDAPVSATGRPEPPAPAVSNALRQTLGLPPVPTPETPTGDDGIGVAIIDSGIAPSDDFGLRITAFYDFTKGGIPTRPYDDYGHGTHIAGLIGSNGRLSGSAYMGIAPDVRLVGLKVLDGKGAGRTSDVIKALEYVVANHSRLNVQIVNLSLGHPIYAPAADDPLVQAVEQATAAGLVVVTAAGNAGQSEKGHGSGYTGITSPGNAPSAITVGAVMTQNTATRADDVVAPYSSRGPTWYDAFAKPDVVAPGHQLFSDSSTSSYLYKNLGSSRAKNGGPFLALSGTSMAAGVTTGVVALVLQAHAQHGPRDWRPMTPNLVKAVLEYSAIPVANADYLTQGAGEINAAGAIELARAIDTDAPLGSWWLTRGVTPASTIGGATYAWGERVVWGGSVRGGNILYAHNIAWSTNIVWGTNVVWGTNIVWGTGALWLPGARVLASNIVWGTSAIWASNVVWGDRVIGQMDGDENIVWGTASDENVVWGTLKATNIVWGTRVNGNNIVWGTLRGENILWGTSAGDENVVWGTSMDENVVWGTSMDENVVWGTGLLTGLSGVLQ